MTLPATMTAPVAQGTPTAPASDTAAAAAPAVPAVVKAPAQTPATPVATPDAAAPASTPAPADAHGAAAPAAEVQYDLKLPEGSLLDQAAVDAVAALSKQSGFSPEQAQGVLEFQNKQRATLQEFHTKQLEELGEKGKAQLQSHPEYGGEKYVQTCEDIKLATTRVFPELAAALGASPLGNDYRLNLGLARLGRMMRAPNAVLGVTPVDGKKMTDAEVFWPHMVTKK